MTSSISTTVNEFIESNSSTLGKLQETVELVKSQGIEHQTLFEKVGVLDNQVTMLVEQLTSLSPSLNNDIG